MEKRSKVTKAKAIRNKPPIKSGGYTDPYNSGSFESKEAFLAIKLKRLKSKFSLVYNALLSINPKRLPIKINVTKFGIEYVDSRLPNYVKGFIPKLNSVKIVPIKSATIEKDNGNKVSGLVEFEVRS